MLLYLQLYWSFFKIGLFSIGGGYASLPLIEKEIVEYHKWIDMTAFTDIITISQMTPGPIAINSSTFVGIQVGGIPGAIVATLGCVTPSVIIVLFLAHIYMKYRNLELMSSILYGLRPAVVSLIGAAGISIIYLAFFGQKVVDWSNININYISVVLFAVSMFFLRKFKTSPIYVMVGCGIVGAVIYNI